MIKDKILRMIDANLNRATEGLRVAEDITRFVLDDAKLTGRLKTIRHKIAKSIGDRAWSIEGNKLRARDVKRDVGARRTTASESKRSNILDVFMANIKRAEESIRVFEETSKLFDAKLGPKFKKLRFELYDIEQKAALSLKKKLKLDNPIYIILDDTFGHSHLEIMKEASKAGATLFQLRDKKLGKKELLIEARRLAKYAKRHGLTLIINDHPDIALKSGADGAHIGARGQLLGARRILGDKILGVSASNMREALRAQALGADYIGFGPVFKTPIKPNAKPTGIKELRRVTNRVTIPIYAIGGVCARTIGQVMASGAAGGAVIRYVSGSEDIKKAVKRLLLLSRRPE